MPDYKLCLLFPHLFLLYYGCVDCVYFCRNLSPYIYIALWTHIMLCHYLVVIYNVFQFLCSENLYCFKYVL